MLCELFPLLENFASVARESILSWSFVLQFFILPMIFFLPMTPALVFHVPRISLNFPASFPVVKIGIL
jgi:hypothetical protein